MICWPTLSSSWSLPLLSHCSHHEFHSHYHHRHYRRWTTTITRATITTATTINSILLLRWLPLILPLPSPPFVVIVAAAIPTTITGDLSATVIVTSSALPIPTVTIFVTTAYNLLNHNCHCHHLHSAATTGKADQCNHQYRGRHHAVIIGNCHYHRWRLLAMIIIMVNLKNICISRKPF